MYLMRINPEVEILYRVHFLLICCTHKINIYLYFFSFIAFILLNNLPQVKEEHASKHQIIADERFVIYLYQMIQLYFIFSFILNVTFFIILFRSYFSMGVRRRASMVSMDSANESSGSGDTPRSQVIP